jgi:hypothetical protein
VRKTLKRDKYNLRSNSFSVVNMRGLMRQLKRALTSKQRDLRAADEDAKTAAERASISRQLGHVDDHFVMLADVRRSVDNFARSAWCDADQIRHARLTIDDIGAVVPESGVAAGHMTMGSANAARGVFDDKAVLQAMRVTADPLPFNAGHWQGDSDSESKFA